ncbi:hypothetical protein CCR75_005553 [Bremia lactucae]|uniref:Uncharacterized protein n=1 Tax=Bremia lactucae TaxID=4779 RepID=A0A976IEV3_BRELC|nr:hypothetical protein CCR75_005553 [Bremia lactucae]
MLGRLQAAAVQKLEQLQTSGTPASQASASSKVRVEYGKDTMEKERLKEEFSTEQTMEKERVKVDMNKDVSTMICHF